MKIIVRMFSFLANKFIFSKTGEPSDKWIWTVKYITKYSAKMIYLACLSWYSTKW